MYVQISGAFFVSNLTFDEMIIHISKNIVR